MMVFSKNKLKKVLLAAVTVLFSQLFQLPVYSKPPSWYSQFKQVKLFESTRSVVERLFGFSEITSESIGETGNSVEYRIKGGELTVEYSSRDCSKLNKPERKFAKDTVIEMSVDLDEPQDISRFEIDLTKFEKVEIGDVKGLFTFSNYGVVITANSDKLHSISVSLLFEQEILPCE